ncbi:23S rRNA (adenine(2030)-N(6))-methyltransferase RlmJ [Frigidibacter sp. MR17.24]|uniref:23S rRNA (adenine(2030)-N(6))-methyltransferase RlmJ n=1 Tax=Frigidibacter sp. MR17.24 TaxID=3127345 RepID=UPI003012C0E4
MLSYQHLYHAGNLADVHKHALLSAALDYMTRKDKPLSYLETHAGRGLYDLAGPEALKTGEAAAGITRALAEQWFAPDHPYLRHLAEVRDRFGPAAYPGSPLIAALALRPGDAMQLAELHPAEHAALTEAIEPWTGNVHRVSGFDMAFSRTPPEPKRGLLLCDPSFEVKEDYRAIPEFLGKVARKWNVGVLMLWYPILSSGLQLDMVIRLRQAFPDALSHEVRFPPARPGHGMVGSGMFVINPPWGLADEAARLSKRFARL